MTDHRQRLQMPTHQPARHSASRALLLALLAGCGGNVNVVGIYFAPWMACVAGGALFGYAATRLLERHLFDYDPRYFAWAFLPLTVLFSFAFWLLWARD